VIEDVNKNIFKQNYEYKALDPPGCSLKGITIGFMALIYFILSPAILIILFILFPYLMLVHEIDLLNSCILTSLLKILKTKRQVESFIFLFNIGMA